MKLVSVACAAAELTENACVIDGRLGKYISIEMGPHAASAPSNRTSRPSGRRRITSDMDINSPRESRVCRLKGLARCSYISAHRPRHRRDRHPWPDG